MGVVILQLPSGLLQVVVGLILQLPLSLLSHCKRLPKATPLLLHQKKKLSGFDSVQQWSRQLTKTNTIRGSHGHLGLGALLCKATIGSSWLVPPLLLGFLFKQASWCISCLAPQQCEARFAMFHCSDSRVTQMFALDHGGVQNLLSNELPSHLGVPSCCSWFCVNPASNETWQHRTKNSAQQQATSTATNPHSCSTEEKGMPVLTLTGLAVGVW